MIPGLYFGGSGHAGGLPDNFYQQQEEVSYGDDGGFTHEQNDEEMLAMLRSQKAPQSLMPGEIARSAESRRLQSMAKLNLFSRGTTAGVDPDVKDGIMLPFMLEKDSRAAGDNNPNRRNAIEQDYMRARRTQFNPDSTNLQQIVEGPANPYKVQMQKAAVVEDTRNRLKFEDDSRVMHTSGVGRAAAGVAKSMRLGSRAQLSMQSGDGLASSNEEHLGKASAEQSGAAYTSRRNVAAKRLEWKNRHDPSLKVKPATGGIWDNSIADSTDAAATLNSLSSVDPQQTADIPLGWRHSVPTQRLDESNFGRVSKRGTFRPDRRSDQTKQFIHNETAYGDFKDRQVSKQHRQWQVRKMVAALTDARRSHKAIKDAEADSKVYTDSKQGQARLSGQARDKIKFHQDALHSQLVEASTMASSVGVVSANKNGAAIDAMTDRTKFGGAGTKLTIATQQLAVAMENAHRKRSKGILAGSDEAVTAAAAVAKLSSVDAQTFTDSIDSEQAQHAQHNRAVAAEDFGGKPQVRASKASFGTFSESQGNYSIKHYREKTLADSTKARRLGKHGMDFSDSKSTGAHRSKLHGDRADLRTAANSSKNAVDSYGSHQGAYVHKPGTVVARDGASRGMIKRQDDIYGYQERSGL